jgi:hypothetical protein
VVKKSAPTRTQSGGTQISRRTVTRGVAWTAPVAAIAYAAPAFATSPYVPPPPVINFGGACGNTGAQQKGCGGDKTLQVPLTLSNQGATAIVFQITSMYTCNCGTAPTGPGAGVAVGVRGVWKTPDHTVPSQNDCSLAVGSACAGGIANVLVPAGTVNATYWIESTELGSSSTFSTRIAWRLLDVATCAVLSVGQAVTASAISPENCNG